MTDETIIAVTDETGAARRDIRGEVLEGGILAVHRSIGDAPLPPPWTLTHIPTELAVCRTNDRESAVEIGRALNELKLPRGWRSKDKMTVQRSLPAYVRVWLLECDAMHGFKPLGTPASRQQSRAQQSGDEKGEM